jgi:hypothetical protein
MSGDLEPPGIVAAEHYPRRGDWIDGWLVRQRDRYQPHSMPWATLDDLLTDYREMADVGIALSAASFDRDAYRR